MKRRILLGLTGSVATVLYEKIIKELQKIGTVDVILTESAKHFVSDDLLTGVRVFTDKDEWQWSRPAVVGKSYTDKWEKNDRVLHIAMRDNHDVLVIAPCSANTLAKIASGMCDNLLTSVARAWDMNRPFVIAPAMNTHMWNHPVTKTNLIDFVNFGKNMWYVKPQEKMLACNTYGMGALADISEIVSTVKNSLRWKFPIYRFEEGGDLCPGIPVDGHPGSFEAKRKNSTHTGVDLYVDEGTPVYAVEDGVVVCVEHFTGPQDNSPWWLNTECVLVEGASGVICYGEIAPHVKVGDKVLRGETMLGQVLRVIPPERPQHPELQGWKPSMLHIEMYPHGYYKPSDGYGNSFNYLIDPTPYLLDAIGAPETLFKKE